MNANSENIPASFSLRKTLLQASSGVIDRKLIAGVFLGLALLGGGYAISASGGSSGSSSYSDPASKLLTDQESIVAEQMIQDAIACGQGKQEGSVGNAMNLALKAHLELASASPNVEQLFSINSDCFAGISMLLDLSIYIPSLTSILAAAQQAVIAYAKKKICSAVANVTGMITAPINQAIGQVNGYIGALNGLSANLNNGGGMSSIDSNLGAAYNVGQSGTYNTITQNQPKQPNQSGQQSQGDGNYDAGGSGGVSTGVDPARIQQLNTQLGALQGSLAVAQGAVDRAQEHLDNCKGSDCDSARQELSAAQQNFTYIQSQLANVQSQLNSLLGFPNNSPGQPSKPGQPSNAGQPFIPGQPISLGQPAQVGEPKPVTIHSDSLGRNPAPRNQTLSQKLGDLFQ